MNNEPIQPYVNPAPVPNYNPPVGPAGDDPGKTLGIIGFIFAFVGLQLIGLILSIIGHNKSHKAGFKNTLAVVGILAELSFYTPGGPADIRPYRSDRLQRCFDPG